MRARALMLRATALFLALALCGSVALNAVLLFGGPLHAPVVARAGAWTGTPPLAARQEAEIASLEERLAAERAALQRSWESYSALSNNFIMERESRRTLRERYVVLSDELQATRQAKDALRAELVELRSARP